MILDAVTSLADLAFRGRTDKRYRQLAVLTATVYYGRVSLTTWKMAISFLHEVATNAGNVSCDSVVIDVNYNREYIKNDWIEPPEPPEQLELRPQPQILKKKATLNNSSLYNYLYDEQSSWWDHTYGSQNNPYNYYTTNDTTNI